MFFKSQCHCGSGRVGVVWGSHEHRIDFFSLFLQHDTVVTILPGIRISGGALFEEIAIHIRNRHDVLACTTTDICTGSIGCPNCRNSQTFIRTAGRLTDHWIDEITRRNQANCRRLLKESASCCCLIVRVITLFLFHRSLLLNLGQIQIPTGTPQQYPKFATAQRTTPQRTTASRPQASMT